MAEAEIATPPICNAVLALMVGEAKVPVKVGEANGDFAFNCVCIALVTPVT